MNGNGSSGWQEQIERHDRLITHILETLDRVVENQALWSSSQVLLTNEMTRLATAQRHTEEELAKLAAAQRRTDEKLGGD